MRARAFSVGLSRGAIAGALLAGLVVTVAVAAQPRLALPSPREPEAGDLLVASRQLDDANFARTVVLLLHYGPRGAQGLILNRPTPVRVAVGLPGIDALANRQDTLYWGGPMEPQSAVLLVQLAEAPPRGVPLVDGVWAVGAGPAMDDLLRRNPRPPSQRVFAGYAGWTAGQLEWELATGAWHLYRGDAGSIFHPEVEELWETLYRLALAPRA